MSNKKKLPHVNAHIIKSHNTVPIEKSAVSEQQRECGGFAVSKWLEPPVDLRGLRTMVSHSSILPQCIRAYKNNIAGFGIGIRYKSGYNDNNTEAVAEYERAEELIELLNMDMDTKKVFEDVIEAREIYGVSYLEVMRNLEGEVTGIEFIKDTPVAKNLLKTTD